MLQHYWYVACNLSPENCRDRFYTLFYIEPCNDIYFRLQELNKVMIEQYMDSGKLQMDENLKTRLFID